MQHQVVLAPVGSPVGTGVREHIPAFDVLRCLAATAVVMIHVLGPYRELLGVIPDGHWIAAIALNGGLRWSVPVFIMITGALMLSDPRPFEPGHYLRRRVVKVLVPFIFFSVAYALLAGFSARGFDGAAVTTALRALPVAETYYHLGFFYYFIPLYLFIPPLSRLVQTVPGLAIVLVLGWLMFTALRLVGVSGPWDLEPVMFGGYLVLGYVLWRYRWPRLAMLAPLGVLAVAVTDWAVVTGSLEAGAYRVGNWLSYRTLNTAIIAASVFTAAIALAERLGPSGRAAFAFVGRHSLGIYLLHPLFLWPARAFGLYAGHPLLMIPLWTLVAGGLALMSSIALSRSRWTGWMVP